MRANFFDFALFFLRLSKRKHHFHGRFPRIQQVVRRMRAAITLVLFSIAVGTVGYVVIEDYPWFDAYYMSVITLASVGFGEVHPLSTYGRLFTSLLIVFNIGLFAYAISTITDVFASGGFTKLLIDFHMNKRINELSGHTIVCGFGRHATEVAQELGKQDMPFVIIEKNPDKIALLRHETTYLYVEGDATHDEILAEAGIDRAAAVVITLPDDAGNLFITLSARQINPSLRIICRANNEADEVKIRRAGADHTVIPERIGGFYMATLIHKPHLVEFFSLLASMGPTGVVFEEVPVSQLRQSFQNTTIADSGLVEKTQVTVVAVREPNGHYELNPPASTILQSGWDLVVLGSQAQMEKFREHMLIH